MLKSSFGLEVETLASSTKVFMEMREFGSFPSTSSLPCPRTQVREGATFPHTGHAEERFLLYDLGTCTWP